MSKLMDGTKEGYARFLTVNLLALRHLRDSLSSRDHDDIDRMIAAAAHDLEIMASKPNVSDGSTDESSANRQVRGATQRSARESGMAYVFRGSRLGARFIERGVPREWPREFLAVELNENWREFCQKIDEIDRAEWNELLAGAEMAFGLFRKEAAAAGAA